MNPLLPYVVMILWLACAGLFVWLCADAPEGYEDETGFHFGRV